MRQRHVVRWLYLLIPITASVIVAAFLLTAHANRVRQKPKFVEPIAFCVVPGMMQQAREEDVPIGYWEQCKYVFREQDI